MAKAKIKKNVTVTLKLTEAEAVLISAVLGYRVNGDIPTALSNVWNALEAVGFSSDQNQLVYNYKRMASGMVTFKGTW